VHGLLESEWKHLLQNLQRDKSKSLYEQPLLIPTLVYLGHRERTEAHRFQIDSRMHKTEVQIGYAIPGVPQDKPLRQLRRPRLKSVHLAFETATRQLHTFSTELGTIINVTNFGTALGAFLYQTAKELENLPLRATDEDAIGNEELLIHYIEYATTLYSTIRNQSTALKDRVHNHINLVSNPRSMDRLSSKC
jgi:hypothetical protein